MTLRAIFTAASAACLALASLGATARAQYLIFESEQLGVPFPGSSLVPRLQAMGGLQWVIPDENNELNLSDFGDNVAAIAADKDGWNIDSWYGQIRNKNDFIFSRGGPLLAQSETVRQEALSTEAVYRNGRGRAIGLFYQWSHQEIKRRLGDDSKTRGPQLGGLWNERIWRFDLGARVTSFGDDQALKTADVFELSHRSKAWIVSLGAATEVVGLDLGGQVEINRNRIDGTSRDPSGFHQDDFRWERPSTRVRLSAALPPGSDLEAAVNVSFLRLRGKEEVQISWSDRFPLNPSQFFYSKKLPTFKEDEDAFAVEGRALYWLAGELRATAYARFEDFTSVVEEAANFKGSRRQQDLDRSTTTLGGGLGTTLLDGALQLGVEAAGVFADTKTILLRTSSDVSSRSLEGRGGVEWFPRSNLALRAGFGRNVIDADLDQPFTLQTGNVISAGVGYTPRGGMVRFDAVVRRVDRTPDEEGGAERENDRTELGLFTRLLF